MIFSALRVFEILTLIPIWGILAYFVDRILSVNASAQVPNEILVLFIVSILATAWAIITLMMYRRMGWAPLWIALIDLGFFGALIAGVVILAPWVRHTDCINVSWEGGVAANKECSMYKAAWALAIIDIILFFFSAVSAWHVWHKTGVVVYEERPRRHGRHHRRSRW